MSNTNITTDTSSTSLDPLHSHVVLPLQTLVLLDRFLSSLFLSQRKHSSGTVEADLRQQNETGDVSKVSRIDDLLRLSSFLFGSTLDGALTLLETNPKRDILRLISLQSNRNIYIVKGRSYRGCATSDSTYMCMLNDRDSQSAIDSFEHPGHSGESFDTTEDYRYMNAYCSCRSFSERCQQSQNGKVLCKHLLAIKLMPFLHINCSVIEVDSDVEYARIILQRIPLD